MRFETTALPGAMTDFLIERHLASLTLVRPDGTPHVTPVGFTWDAERQLVRIITWSGSVKARLLESAGARPAAVCQVDGGRWASLHGWASVTDDPAQCRDGVARYADRYSTPKDRGPERRVIEIAVDSILGRV